MDNGNVAYYRDATVGAINFLTADHDGESWSSRWLLPDGTALEFPTVTFYADYGGQQNCFVGPGQTLCNTISVEVIWYTDASQCGAPGTWTGSFLHEGAATSSQVFTLKPQIKENAVGSDNQHNYHDTYDHTSKTISRLGCALTDATIVLGYHGVSVSPPALNEWLNNNDGYKKNGNIIWDRVADFGTQSLGRPIHFLGFRGGDDNLICHDGPQIAHLNYRRHFVTVYGYTDDSKNTFLVHDPDAGLITALGTGSIDSLRVFQGPQQTFLDPYTGFTFSFFSPVEAYVTDPIGRRTGYDPATQTIYNEIPGGHYDQNLGLDDDETGEQAPDVGKEVEVMTTNDGTYTLTVTGTATGTYDADFHAWDANLNASTIKLSGVPITQGQVQTFALNFSSTQASNLTLQTPDAFNGGGQRPRDVNAFLSYLNPAQSNTTLPAGVTTFPLTILYGGTTLPTTFSASLNGTDITGLFHPAVNGAETVTLSLAAGTNVLDLSIQGTVSSGRVAPDHDRLVVITQ